VRESAPAMAAHRLKSLSISCEPAAGSSNGALAVQITPGVLSGEPPQPVATFHAPVGTQRNHYRQLFEEISAVRFSNIRAVANRTSWRHMKCHYVPSP
jgi:hypothetical protein